MQALCCGRTLPLGTGLPSGMGISSVNPAARVFDVV
jgi:hypothetical protein